MCDLRRVWLAAFVAILLVALSSACDDDIDGVEPRTNLTGRWIYRLDTLVGAGVSCEMEDEFLLDLVQRSVAGGRIDATFRGTSSRFRLVCRKDRFRTLFDPTRTTVRDGVLDGAAVSFDFEAPNFRHTGEVVAEGEMAGELAFQFDFSGTQLDVGTVNLVGRWIAVRAGLD